MSVFELTEISYFMIIDFLISKTSRVRLLYNDYYLNKTHDYSNDEPEGSRLNSFSASRFQAKNILSVIKVLY